MSGRKKKTEDGGRRTERPDYTAAIAYCLAAGWRPRAIADRFGVSTNQVMGVFLKVKRQLEKALLPS